MKEVKTICPQCGQSDSYFEYEEGDFTGGITFPQKGWECSHCSYPRVTWTKWSRTWRNSTSVSVSGEDSPQP